MSESSHQLELRVRQLERGLRRQRRASHFLLATAALFVSYAFQDAAPVEHFAHVSVERLDVVEPDGALALTLANSAHLPEPLIAGQTIATGRTGPGMIFFDGKGWEVGGLTFGNQATDEGYRAGAHLAFDQYHNDQVVFLSYQDDGEHKRSGLHVVDRAREPTLDQALAMQADLDPSSAEERRALAERLRGTVAQRVFVGSEDETAMVRLRDRAGRERARLSVAPDGVARLELLDEAGAVVASLPE